MDSTNAKLQKWLFLIVLLLVGTILPFSPTWAEDQSSSFNCNDCLNNFWGGDHQNFLEPLWAQIRIGSFLVDDLLTKDEKETPIKIMVYDSPIDESLEAFNGINIISCPEAIPPFRMRKKGYLGHGSQVAGIFASKYKCSIGNTKNIEFHSWDNSPNGHSDDIIHAIEHALDEGIQIINLSTSIYFDEPYSEKVQSLIKKIKENKIILVWAAGNGGFIRKHFPDDVDNIITVGSVDPVLKRSNFSSHGDFVAPGDNLIKSVDPKHTFGGTSAAAPVLSGTILNMLKVNPHLSPREIREILKVTSFDIGSNEGFDEDTGWGMINIPRAIIVTKLLRDRNFKLAGNIKKDREKVQEVLRNNLSNITYNDLKSKRNCSEYVANLHKLFLDYFLTENSTEIAKFYMEQDIAVSAALYGKENAKKYIKTLEEKRSSDNSTIGTVIDHALGAIGKPVIDSIISEISKTNEGQAQVQLFEKMISLENENANDFLFSILKGADTTMAYKVIEAFLYSSGLTNRVEIRNTDYTIALIEYLKKESDDVHKKTIIRALRNLRNKVAVDYLMSLLDNSNEDLSIEAAIALCYIRDSRAVVPIMHLLRKDLSLSAKGNLLSNFWMLSSEMKDITPFLIILQDPKEDSFIKSLCSNVLSHVPGDIVTEPLSAILGNEMTSSEVKIKIMNIFSTIDRSRDVVQPIIERLQDSDKQVRLVAIRRLAFLQTEKGDLALISLLNDPDSEIKKEVIEKLGRGKDKRAVEPIIELLQDKNEEVRGKAIEFLTSFLEDQVPSSSEEEELFRIIENILQHLKK